MKGKNISLEVDKKDVKELVKKMEEGIYVLPTFQRRFEWDEEDIKELIQSISSSCPIGAIILWKPSEEKIKESKYYTPFIDVQDNKNKPQYFVIDGQQRLTSLLLMFNNWSIIRNKKLIKTRPISYNPSNGRLFISSQIGHDVSRIIKSISEFDAKLKESVGEADFGRVSEYAKSILDYEIPIYVMETFNEDENIYKEMADAFIKVNKQGVRIGNIELMLSFFEGTTHSKLKEQIYDIYDSLENESSLDLQPVLRLIFSKLGLKQTQITKVEQFRSNIEKISKIEDNTLRITFDRCKTSLKLAIGILNRYMGIHDLGILPSQIPLVVIASYIYEKKFDQLDQIPTDEITKIIDWLILVSFNGYYSSSPDTKLQNDLTTLRDQIEVFPFNKLCENPKLKKITIEDFKKGLYKNMFHKEGKTHLLLLYTVLVRNNADDWAGSLIKTKAYKDLARHHIFPKEYLQSQLDVEDEDEQERLINNLGNITFIHKEINSSIGSLSPTDYLGNYMTAIQKHCISGDRELWKIENYEEFLNDRIEKLYNVAKREFPNIII